MKLLAGIDTWIRDPNAEKIIWVYGHAGSGKSALLNSVARNLEKAYIPFSFFTCKRDDVKRSDVRHILPTICYSFTRLYDDYHGNISNITKQQEGLSITTGDVSTQMELLFGESPSYEVVSPKRANRPRVHVVLIDALDECNDIRARSALAKHLRDLANGVSWIKVIITSRPVPDIVDTIKRSCSTTSSININGEEWNTSADIRLFIEAQSAQLELGLSPSQIDRFQEKASGLFIWCTTVFRYIEESKESRSRTVADVLQDHSPDAKDNPHAPLYFLYQHVLDSAVSRSRDKELMETILGVIFVASTRKPLSTTAITDLLYHNERSEVLSEKREWVTNIIKSLFAIMYVEEGTDVVRTCHLSVLDFIGGILSGKLSTLVDVRGEYSVKPFSICLDEVHERVFEGCLAVMKRELRFNICNLEDSFRLNDDVADLPSRIKEQLSEALQYGTLFWMSHLEQSGSKNSAEQVVAFLNTQSALFWVEALSLLDAIDQGIVALQDCAQLFAVRPPSCDSTMTKKGISG